MTLTDTYIPSVLHTLPRQQDCAAAAAQREPTDPSAGADALAVRCDRLGESRAAWAARAGEMLELIRRLSLLADRRQDRLDALRATERQAARQAAQAAQAAALQSSLAETRRLLQRSRDEAAQAAELQSILAETRRLLQRSRDEAAHLRLTKEDAEALALGRREVERRNVARAAAKADRIAAACRAVQDDSDITPQIRTGLRAMVGASRATPVRLVDKGAPRLTGEASYYVTKGGEICRHPAAYRRTFGRAYYVPSTEEVTVSAAWIRTHAPSISTAAMA